MSRAISLLLALPAWVAALATPLAADDDPLANPATAFAVHCAACHLPDQALVGPSLVEMAALYRDDVEGFVAWSIEPGRKRMERIPMPSMAHVGEDALREIHGHILAAAEGLEEREPPAADPFTLPPDLQPRPAVQRIFLPDASPAAIAVALPGDLSFCFDAAECRLRYVWQGGFILGGDHWRGNGSRLAVIDGQVIYREDDFLIRPAAAGSEAEDPAPPRFLGYSLHEGLPTFRYVIDGLTIRETIRPLADGGGIERHFETDGSRDLLVSPPENATLEPALDRIPATDASSLTLTLRWK